jgi:hypothetical protein
MKKMARKTKAQNAAEETKEEAVPVETPVETLKEEAVAEPAEMPEEDPTIRRIAALETIVENLAKRITKLEANAPKRLTSADFCGM